MDLRKLDMGNKMDLVNVTYTVTMVSAFTKVYSINPLDHMCPFSVVFGRRRPGLSWT